MDHNILEKEEMFHDEWAHGIDIDGVMVDEFFEACTSPENRYIISQMGDIRGKYVLEIGCGLGEASVYLSKRGARVVATDLSAGMLNVTRKLAKKHNVTVETKHASSADFIEFHDETFDIVYAANLLHHVDINSTINEVYRVLKKGGKFYSWDPLAHNPIINIYRKKATGVRTEDEHPLKMNDIRLFKEKFSRVTYLTTWFFTLWVFIRFYLVDRIDPNKERYWKKILVDHKRLETTYNMLEKCDRFVLTLFPFLRRYCWNIVVVSEK